MEKNFKNAKWKWKTWQSSGIHGPKIGGEIGLSCFDINVDKIDTPSFDIHGPKIDI